MSNELIINAALPETRIALMENGEIQELLIERASGKGIVGNIYKGRVTRVLPGMQAAFVDIGLEKAAFLYVDDVYVHPEVWEAEEGVAQPSQSVLNEIDSNGEYEEPARVTTPLQVKTGGNVIIAPLETPAENVSGTDHKLSSDSQLVSDEEAVDAHMADRMNEEEEDEDEDERDSPEDDHPESMGADDSEDESPSGTVAPKSPKNIQSSEDVPSDAEGDASKSVDVSSEDSTEDKASGTLPARRRGRRSSRFRRRPPVASESAVPVAADSAAGVLPTEAKIPENFHEQVADVGNLDSDRTGLGERDEAAKDQDQPIVPEAGRPETATSTVPQIRSDGKGDFKNEFRSPRSRDRRIRPKTTARPVKVQVNIQDLLKEGQEVLVQVAKDPIATKGARLTCHISLPGRHLVCMPTIDHVGVSRRIEKDDERRRLREYVERNRTKNLGFIVRTASGKQQSEKRIKQDIDYLTRLWSEIREKAGTVSAPALVYEDLNSVLRAIRDWVTEEIDKVIVDSRYHFNDIQRFVAHFMPSLKQKIELYHGDIPIFDAYGISTELSRALERKVWLKSGGYIVIDQAEALVAIDVNTGRYVGKKNLEDTILKTNLEAVQEIAYQLRLRNCGGIIILDLIDMEKDENKHRVYRALEDALSRDRARPTILKISELGLVEMTRKRTRDTIIRTLCESCAHCEGKGFIKSKQTVAYEVLREIEREGVEREVGKVLVQAHPDVIDILAIDERDTLDQLEKRYRKLVYLQSMPEFHAEQFEVIAEKKSKAERSWESAAKSRSENERGGRNRNNRTRSAPPSTSAPLEVKVSSAEVETKPVPTPTLEVITQATTTVSVVGPIIQTHTQTTTTENTTENVKDGFYDEEDRLAFLRAQAAQDAALARLGGSSGSSPHAARTVQDLANRTDKTPRKGLRNRRGGGKFRRNFSPRGVKQFGHPQPKWNDTVREPSAKESRESEHGEMQHQQGISDVGPSEI